MMQTIAAIIAFALLWLLLLTFLMVVFLTIRDIEQHDTKERPWEYGI